MEISIIMPIYNETDLLKRSIVSVLNQTHTDWELILVDDGSIEPVFEICRRFAQKDKRIKVYRQAHAGQATARNKGLELATGKYIAFMDADDYMHPQMLEQLYRDIMETGVLIAAGGFARVEEIPLHSTLLYSRPVVINVGEESKSEKHTIVKDNVYLWNKLYHRQLFKHIRFADGRFYEDLAIMHRLFAVAERISYNRNILYYYYRNPRGTICTVTEKKIADCIWAYEQRIDFYYQRNYEKDLNHVTHAFLYKTYELYMTEKSGKKELKRKIRKRVYRIFTQYDLEQYLPLHGKIRYKLFLRFPELFEAYTKLRFYLEKSVFLRQT